MTILLFGSRVEEVEGLRHEFNTSRATMLRRIEKTNPKLVRTLAQSVV
jgi:hypothetical protein